MGFKYKSARHQKDYVEHLTKRINEFLKMENDGRERWCGIYCVEYVFSDVLIKTTLVSEMVMSLKLDVDV